jgi:hypothetical protein
VRRLLAALLVALAACSNAGGGGDGRAAPSPTTATTTTTAAPTTTTTGPGARPATADCPAIPGQPAPDPDRPVYDMDVRVLPDENAVDGRLTVRFRPDVGTDRLVFRLWPNGPRAGRAGARLDVGPVLLDGEPAPAADQPDPTTLVVDAGRLLLPGDEVEATVPWRLTLPGTSNDRIARDGDAIRLGSFFPILAWEPGVGWALDPPTGAFAEASTAPVGDFAYTVEVPDGLTVLASGQRAGTRWTATAVRDVAVSVGRFRIAEGTANAPTPVQVTVGVAEGLADDPAAYLDRVVRSLEDFAERFGPYPYPSLTFAVTPGLSGGIEYPAHIMQGPGTIGRTTPHEVAHQWFYGLVGNSQGRDPWLDEGLATWGEARFERTLDDYVDRPVPGDAAGRVGEPMTFWESRTDNYYRGVYVQGAQLLAALGPPEKVDCALRLYVANEAYGIARPVDLLDAVQQVFPDAAATFDRFGADT